MEPLPDSIPKELYAIEPPAEAQQSTSAAAASAAGGEASPGEESDEASAATSISRGVGNLAAGLSWAEPGSGVLRQSAFVVSPSLKAVETRRAQV